MRARFDAALLTRPPRLLHSLLPGCEWTGPAATPTGTPVVYLTFDDGPIPEETPWVLEQLASFDAKATFFCVGDNLVRHPDIARATLAAGHRLGNHTQHHRSAWASPRATYLEDVAACEAQLRQVGVGEAGANQLLFRPPHGRLTWPLLRALRPQYRVAMWSVLTRDYDPDLSPELCLRFALDAIRGGDIVVFHDSLKASPRLRFVLPRVLAHLAEQGFQFSTL
ncbi:MAG TPA: polysaccharide deacetylase family protein [Hymenobacter sp.]|jgi:peptidoglycan/xylan/chitin deacetylase (PgdA/CDA1 family)|uniref:polysaccharide deacetylase family protein n=1 Tax=Hymenobacter sp. TaxID=1898978 RepID=UPI002EDBA36D